MQRFKATTLRQFTAFHTVARHASVSRAADELHLTQPAVSIQIGMLEQAAGTPLLERVGRGVRLTEAGVMLAQTVGRMLDLLREAGENLDSLRGVFSGTLRVGAVTTAEYLLPPLLVTFADENPKVKVKLQVGNRDQIVQMLSGQEVDVAIMGRPPRELKTVAVPFAKHPMAFLAAPTHALMQRRSVTLADIADANLLVRERGSGTRTTVERLFKDGGTTLRIGSELSSNEAIKQMCAAGFGAAFLSLHTCVLELEAGVLQLVPLADNPIERDWYVMHLASRTMPAVAQAFERFLLERGPAQMLRQLNRRVVAGSATKARRRTRGSPAVSG